MLSCDADSVKFRYTLSGSKKSKTRTVSGEAFVRGFLQHVLPSGFQKVRSYGWMNPKSSLCLAMVRWLVSLFLNEPFVLASNQSPETPDPKPPHCRLCGGDLILKEIVKPEHGLPLPQAVPYQDSG